MLKRLLHASAIILASCGTPAYAEEFTPLTRDEPVVRMVLQEAANEPFAGMVAVAGVAIDRALDRRWPSTIREVIYQHAQFSGMLLKIRIYSPEQITRARQATNIAAIGFRPCGRVLWYHADWMLPNWANGRIKMRCQIGDHIFYGDK